MTTFQPSPTDAGQPAPQSTRTARPDTMRDLRLAAILTAGLTVLGALLGLVWAWWSPPGPVAEIFSNGQNQPDETEAFIQQDGRFLTIAVAVGLIAGIVLWTRVRTRGPLVATALGIGSVLGSLAMWGTGRLVGGGDGTGNIYRYADGSSHRLSKQLPLTLHAHGVLFVQAAVALLVYALCVAFAKDDDLGRPDDLRTRLRERPATSEEPGGPYRPGEPHEADGSVDAGDHPQGGWGHRDAAGVLQQGDLPPQ